MTKLNTTNKDKTKTVLFFFPGSLKEPFLEGFQKLGYNVIDFFEEIKMPKWNLLNKLTNILWRVFLKRNDYPVVLKKRQFERSCNKRLKQVLLFEIDYAVFFRADTYNEKFIKKLYKKNVFMSSYQCDTLKGRGLEILKYDKYMNQVFCFDPDDLMKYKDYKLKFLTNCFFVDNVIDKGLLTNKIYYAGTGTNHRIDNIHRLNDYLRESNFEIYALLVVPPNRMEQKTTSITLTHHAIDYIEILRNVKQSFVIVDMADQNGLSFRFFEAMYYKKKIITNNIGVLRYDFYNPQNIFITDFVSFTGLEEWLQTEYVELSREITNKYSFENWAAHMLDLPSKLPITLIN